MSEDKGLILWFAGWAVIIIAAGAVSTTAMVISSLIGFGLLIWSARS